MKYCLSIIFLLQIFTAKAERSFVDYNQLFNNGEGYKVYDVTGKNNTWYWENRSLLVSNEFVEKNDFGQYPVAEDWVVFGPYDLSLATEAEFSFDYELAYGSNAISVMGCTDFPGYTNGIAFTGDWEMLMSQDKITPALNVVKNYMVDLAQFEGKKNVYIAFKFAMPLSTEAWINKINRIELTREVSSNVKEIVPPIEISRSTGGTDYFNLSGTPNDNSLWSVRTGYAKATSGNNAWLVMRSFDLTTSGDAFFSFQSQILNGNNGPVGLEIKVANVRFDATSLVNKIEWTDYSKGRFDHRIYPTDFFASGMLDLSQFIGDWVTIAFRYINPQGEQYNVKDFKLYHLPDITPPIIEKLEVDRVVYNGAYIKLSSSERSNVYWAIYPASTNSIDYESIKTGTGAISQGENLYDFAKQDTVYDCGGTVANTSYNLFVAVVDFNGNVSDIKKVSFTTPDEDLVAPQMLNPLFSATNNYSTQFSFTSSEPCFYYYLLKEENATKPSVENLLNLGKSGKIEEETDQLGFYNLIKNTSYVLYLIAEDYAGNQSGIIEYDLTTSNDDLDVPLIEKLELVNSSGFGAIFTVLANEAGLGYYVIQNMDQMPPGYKQILAADDVIAKGTFQYNTANQDVEFNVNGLENSTSYFCYIMIKDEAGNYSLVKAISFTTSSDNVPIIEKVVNQRLIIDREAEYVFEKEDFNVLNGVDINEYSVHIFEGENYTVKNNSIVAADRFTGSIKVPVCVSNLTTTSNVLEYDFIVDYQAVQDSMAGLRRNMVGGHLDNIISDISTNAALLDIRVEDGSFFDKPSENSKEYPVYMTKILGGRMRSIAKDYYNERFRTRKASDVRHKMYQAVEYWIDHKPGYVEPDAPLLWPNYLGAVVLPLYNDMMLEYQNTPSRREEIDRLIAKIDSFNRWCWTENVNSKLTQPYSGSNLTARVWGTLALSAFTGNVELSFEVYDTMVSNLNIQYNSADKYPAGIMADGSFTMNNTSGAQWNWYTYGLNWLDEVIDYARISKRTHWRLPADKINILGYAIPNGLEWLHWNDFIPAQLTGKYFSDNGSKSSKNFMLQKMNEIRYEGFVNNADLETNEIIFKDYENVKEEFYTRDSTKYFWNSNALIYSSQSYFSTLFMPSNRTGAFETGLDTIYGLKSTFLGDGAVFSYNGFASYGRRYLLDHRKLPGTTVERRNIIFPYNLAGKNGKSKNSFAGGVSDGHNAACGFFYNREVNTANVTGYKSYFFFKDCYVALGTGINKLTANKVYSVGTTLENEVLDGKISYSVKEGQIQSISGSVTNSEFLLPITEPSWFHAGGKGFYVFPNQDYGTDFKIKIEKRIEAWDVYNGSWKVKEIEYDNYQINYDTAVVMTFEIDHGKEFENAQYAYMAVPGKGESAFIDYIEQEPVTVISNTSKLQAVRNNLEGVFGIAFIEPGEINLSDDLKLSVDKPSYILLKEGANDLIEVWVSDPYQKEEIIEIIMVKTFKNKPAETTQRLVAFPSGIYKGKAAYTNNGNIWDAEVNTEQDLEALPSEIYKEQAAYTNNENLWGAKVNTELKVLPGASSLPEAESELSFDLKVYPVPVKSSQLLNVDYTLETDEKVQINVIDVFGRSVYSKNQNQTRGKYQTQLDCSQFGKGVYVVKIVAGRRMASKTILVN